MDSTNYSYFDLRPYMDELERTVMQYFRRRKLVTFLMIVLAVLVFDRYESIVLSASAVCFVYLLLTRPNKARKIESFILSLIADILFAWLLYSFSLLHLISNKVVFTILYLLFLLVIVFLVDVVMKFPSCEALTEKAAAIMDYCLMMTKYGEVVDVARVLTRTDITNYDLYNEFHSYFPDIEPDRLKKVVCKKIHKD